MNHADLAASGTSRTYGTAVVFLLNSLFAPGGTAATAHQPYLRDTLAGQYRRYRVESVAWQMDAVINSAATGTYFVTARVIQPGDVSTIGATTVAVGAEKFQTWSEIMVASGPRQLVTFRGSSPVYKLLGLTRDEYEAQLETYSAAAGASPAQSLGFELAVAQLNGTGTDSVQVVGRIMYKSMWFEPIVVAQS